MSAALQVASAQAYDTRLGETLDALFPKHQAVWQTVIQSAIQQYHLPLTWLHYDITSTYFEGLYTESEMVQFDYSRDQRFDSKQLNLGVNVTGDGLLLAIRVLISNTANVTTPRENLTAVRRLLPEDQATATTIVHDRGMATIETFFLLPVLSSMSPNVAQILVAFEARRTTIAMLPDARILVGRNEDTRLGRIILQTRIHFAFVVTAVRRVLLKRCLNLTQQGFHHRIIAHAMRDQNSGLNFSTRRGDAQMEFAPCAPFGLAVRAHFPFAFAVDFQPRAIHDEVLLAAHFFGQLHLKTLTATRQRGMAGYSQVQPEQLEYRAHKVFGLAIG